MQSDKNVKIKCECPARSKGRRINLTSQPFQLVPVLTLPALALWTALRFMGSLKMPLAGQRTVLSPLPPPRHSLKGTKVWQLETMLRPHPVLKRSKSTSPMSPPPDTCLSWTSECVVLQGVHILLGVSYSKGFMYCWGLVPPRGSCIAGWGWWGWGFIIAGVLQLLWSHLRLVCHGFAVLGNYCLSASRPKVSYNDAYGI